MLQARLAAPIGCPVDVRARGLAAGDCPGAHRVPADLLLGPPDPGSVAAGLHVPARSSALQQDLRRGSARRHPGRGDRLLPVSYTHLRAHETDSYLVCRLLLEKKK